MQAMNKAIRHHKQITIVMPVYNGATTLDQVFDGLDHQQNKKLVDKIIIINDNSLDESRTLVDSYAKWSPYTVKVINHNTAAGLAGSYNEGIQLAHTDYVFTMHQDIVLTNQNSFSQMLQPFKDPLVKATFPVLLHPYEVWQTYSFWQKCLFSRFVGKKLPMLTGKFDCFSKSFLAEVGFFDNKTYRTAGEDSDLKVKIKKNGFTSVNSGVEVIHLQYAEKNFSLTQLIKKEAQLAEAQGAVLRKHGLHDIKGVILSFFRQILLIGLLIPYINIFSLLLVLTYTFTYTKLVYINEYNDSRILLLPFLNLYLLFISLFASSKGFITGKQSI